MAARDEHARIRFKTLQLRELPDSRCAAQVVLAWHPGSEFVGTAEGVHSDVGRLRCAAEATARALELAVDSRVTLELLGVTTIKAFDAVIVVVSLASRHTEHKQHVVGSAVTTEDLPIATVRAVLNATNRLLGSNVIYLR